MLLGKFDGADLLKRTTFFSTVTDGLQPSWRPETYQTYPIHTNESIFRQDPSDDVDAAWNRVSDVGVLVISSDDVRRLGKNPATVIRAPESWGHGLDAHLAHLDGVHLIHCLNAMRKSLYHNFARYYPKGTSMVYHSHLSHCQEALAKHLLCQPSVEMITYNWVERQRHPFPDFDITRKCWDFESLLEWQDQNRVKNMTQAKWKHLRPGEDVHPLPVPLLMLEAYNTTLEEAESMD